MKILLVPCGRRRVIAGQPTAGKLKVTLQQTHAQRWEPLGSEQGIPKHAPGPHNWVHKLGPNKLTLQQSEPALSFPPTPPHV